MNAIALMRGKNAVLNKKGFTLVEVMIALVVSLVIGLALMQTAMVGIDSNMLNVLRDEAVSIAERKVSDARNVPFDSLVSVASSLTTDASISSVRNLSLYRYGVQQTVSSLGSDSKLVVITVTWDWKDKTAANGNPYTHTITTVVRRT